MFSILRGWPGRSQGEPGPHAARRDAWHRSGGWPGLATLAPTTAVVVCAVAGPVVVLVAAGTLVAVRRRLRWNH